MLVVEVRPGADRADPELVAAEPLHQVLVVARVAVQVDAGDITRVLNHLAEDHRARRQLLAVYVLGARAGDGLPVEGDGHRHLVRFYELEDEERLLGRLDGAHGLREEIDAHVQPGLDGPGDIRLELLVDHELPRLAAPVSAANHREFYAVGRDGLPVYLALVERDVDAAPGRIFRAGVLGPAAREVEVLFFEHGGRDAPGGRYPLIAPARVHIDLALVLVGRGLTAAGGEGYG